MPFIRLSISVILVSLLQFSVSLNSTKPGTNQTIPPSFDEDYGQYNASGSLSVEGFRPDDTFPASSWVWSRYIQKLNSPKKSSSLQNETWHIIGVQTSLGNNLTGVDIPFTACVIAPIGFSTTVEFDDGTCSSVFGPQCVRDMNAVLQSYAYSQSLSRTPGAGCAGIDQRWTTKFLSSCKGLNNSAISTVLVEAGVQDRCDVLNAGPGGFELFSWGDMPKVDTYDNAVRYPAPVMVMAWRNETSGGRWSDARFLCVPANETRASSRSLEEIKADDNESGAMEMRVEGWVLLGVLGLLGFIVF